MSLLDKDAKDLKARSESSPPAQSSGRKASLSGLGMLKGVGKAKELTSKYRNATPENVPQKKPVEQFVDNSDTKKDLYPNTKDAVSELYPNTLYSNTELKEEPKAAIETTVLYPNTNESVSEYRGEEESVLYSNTKQDPSFDPRNLYPNTDVVFEYKTSSDQTKQTAEPVSRQDEIKNTPSLYPDTSVQRCADSGDSVFEYKSEVLKDIAAIDKVVVSEYSGVLASKEAAVDSKFVFEYKKESDQSKDLYSDTNNVYPNTNNKSSTEDLIKSEPHGRKFTPEASISQKASVDIDLSSIDPFELDMQTRRAKVESSVKPKSIDKGSYPNTDHLYPNTAKSVSGYNSNTNKNYPDTKTVYSNSYPNTYSNTDLSPDGQLRHEIRSLSTTETKALAFICRKCLSNNSTVTSHITRSEFCNETGMPVSTVKTIAMRLKKSDLIKIIDHRSGSNGWTIYGVSQRVLSIVSEELMDPGSPFSRKLSSSNVNQYSNTNSDTYPDIPRSSKLDSQFLKNNFKEKTNTNYTQEAVYPNTSAPSWFSQLDFTSIGFMRATNVNSSIRRLVEERIEKDLVQDFINKFPIWLSEQSNTINPIGRFCDMIKRFAEEGDSPVLMAKTEAEILAEAEFAKKIDEIRSKKALIEKMRGEQVKLDAEKKFDEWYEKASREELETLVQPTHIIPFKSDLYHVTAKSKFVEIESTGGAGEL